MKNLFCALALAALPAPAPGQVLTFSVRSDLVVFSATAVDGKGRPVTDLRRDEFRVYDDGRAQSLAHFHQGQGLPARVLLLVDASGSMNDKWKVASARRAAGQILDALGPEDQVALAGFDSRYWGVVAFTRDKEEVRRGLASVTPFGSTALHDALDKAARDIASHGEGRRAVVVLTDGVDTSSQSTPDQVIERSRALDVPIYAVSVVSPLDDPASEALRGRQGRGQGRGRGGDALPLRQPLGRRGVPRERRSRPRRRRRQDRKRAEAPVPPGVGPAAGLRPFPSRGGGEHSQGRHRPHAQRLRPAVVKPSGMAGPEIPPPADSKEVSL